MVDIRDITPPGPVTPPRASDRVAHRRKPVQDREDEASRKKSDKRRRQPDDDDGHIDEYA